MQHLFSDFPHSPTPCRNSLLPCRNYVSLCRDSVLPWRNYVSPRGKYLSSWRNSVLAWGNYVLPCRNSVSSFRNFLLTFRNYVLPFRSQETPSPSHENPRKPLEMSILRLSFPHRAVFGPFRPPNRKPAALRSRPALPEQLKSRREPTSPAKPSPALTASAPGRKVGVADNETRKVFPVCPPISG